MITTEIALCQLDPKLQDVHGEVHLCLKRRITKKNLRLDKDDNGGGNKQSNPNINSKIRRKC